MTPTLVEALREIAREQSAPSGNYAADRFQQIARQALATYDAAKGEGAIELGQLKMAFRAGFNACCRNYALPKGANNSDILEHEVEQYAATATPTAPVAREEVEGLLSEIADSPPSGVADESSTVAYGQGARDMYHAMLRISTPATQPAREVEQSRSKVGQCLAFFASVIKSGEPWTSTCEQEYTEAQAALARLSPDEDRIRREAIEETAPPKTRPPRERLVKAHFMPEPAPQGRGSQRTACGKEGMRCHGSPARPGWPAEYDTPTCDRFEATSYPEDVTCGRCKPAAIRALSDKRREG